MSSEKSEELIDIDYDMISAFNESKLERSKENIVFEMIYKPKDNIKEKKRKIKKFQRK